ncbi:Ig-like domain-containing protein, partial [Buttiauxella gaviniae]|uniref:Ig-like domain-containing protein n=1 Tax=Buttiauxella gaviniae TaxID=82990 RepID=UPI003975E75C
LTSTKAGISTVTASINGTSRTVDVTFIADSSTATIATGNLTVVTNDAVANGTTTNSVKVKVTDANGHLLENQQVTVTADNSAVVGNVDLTDANGEVTVTLTSTKAGVSTITATIGSTSRTVNVTFVADSATATIATGNLTVVNNNAVATGTDTNSVKVKVTDANGNTLENQQVAVTAGNSAVVGTVDLTDTNGEVTVTLTSTTVGVSTVTAVLGSTSVTANVTFVTPTITIVKLLDTQLANGLEANTFKVTVKGFQGAAVPNQAVTLSTRETTSVIDEGNTVDTDANGEALVGVRNPGNPGTTDILYATVAGTNVRAQASHTWMEKHNFTNKTDITTIGQAGVTSYSVRRTCTWTVTAMTTGNASNVTFGLGLRQAAAILGTAPNFPSNGTSLAVSGGTYTVTSDIGWGGPGVANTQNFQLRVGSLASGAGGANMYIVANDGKINCSAVDAYND